MLHGSPPWVCALCRQRLAGIRKETEDLTLELESGGGMGWLEVGESWGAVLGEGILGKEWRYGVFLGTACSCY